MSLRVEYCHSERSEEFRIMYRAIQNNSQRCFASLNMTRNRLLSFGAARRISGHFFCLPRTVIELRVLLPVVTQIQPHESVQMIAFREAFRLAIPMLG